MTGMARLDGLRFERMHFFRPEWKMHMVMLGEGLDLLPWVLPRTLLFILCGSPAEVDLVRSVPL